MGEYGLLVETDLSAETLRARLAEWQPWRYEVVFSNGVRTTEFETAEPFVREPLAKWHLFKDHLPVDQLRGGRALDVGSNIGHFSIFLRREMGMEVLGLELSQRNLEVASFLVETAGLDRVRFSAEDANVFRSAEPFDLILHLGTLDHFKNPFVAIENAATMLRPGGFLVLELQTYKDPGADETVSKFQPHPEGSQHTVWWLLGKQALEGMLVEAGFSEVQIVHEWSAPEKIGPNMRRLSLIARVPESHSRSADRLW